MINIRKKLILINSIIILILCICNITLATDNEYIENNKNLKIISIILIIIIILIAFNIIKYFYKNRNNFKCKEDYNGHITKNRKNKNVNNNVNNNMIKQKFQKMFEGSKALERQIETEVMQIYKTFNKEEFIDWVKAFIIKFKDFWILNNHEGLKNLETENLYKNHKLKLEEFKSKNINNFIDVTFIKYCSLYEFDADTKRLTVKLNCKMIDYLFDNNTKKNINGNKNNQVEKIYYLSFDKQNDNLSQKTKDEYNSWKLSDVRLQ